MYIKNRLPFRPNKLRTATLNLLIDSRFLICCWTYSITPVEYAEKAFLNTLVLAKINFNSFCVAE